MATSCERGVVESSSVVAHERVRSGSSPGGVRPPRGVRLRRAAIAEYPQVVVGPDGEQGQDLAVFTQGGGVLFAAGPYS